jgi:selenocysteine lyase/cysteine desulfurase
MDRLAAHVARLTMTLIQGLLALRHDNGSPMARLYGPTNGRDRGGTVALNVLREDGRVIPYWVVEERARALGVAVRGGCFCNPGAAEAAFGFDAGAAARCLAEASDSGFNVQHFGRCMGRDGRTAVGAVRASLGMANNRDDVDRAIGLVQAVAV